MNGPLLRLIGQTRLWPFVLLLMISLPLFSIGQTSFPMQKNERQGKWFVYWGWNRGWYTDSDLLLKGKDYRFTLRHAKAADRPTSFDLNTYFNPAKVSTPQFNFRFGYYVRERLSISFGLDHMKYVLTENQNVAIDGHIDDPESPYQGEYSGEKILLLPGLLEYEHTDGLNYLNLEVRHENPLWVSNAFNLYLIEGIGAGPVMPRTDATLMGQDRHNKYHLSGYGVNMMLGLQFGFLKHFFIQSEWKGGYMNLPDVRTTYDSSDKAAQHFYFMQFNWSVGAMMRL